MVKLRDISSIDIDDYIKWFTTEIEWMDFDAPWEKESDNPLEVEERYRRILERTSKMTATEIRYRFEIEVNNEHIGWVSSYFINGNSNKLAIGIDIPMSHERGKSYGFQSTSLFIEYLKGKGFEEIYTQTWSGNLRMINLANKLGFMEIQRDAGTREVNAKKYDALTFRKIL